MEPTTPPPIQPTPSRLANILNWLKSHKKLVLAAVAIIFLFIFLGFTIYQAVKGRLFPTPTQNIQTTPSPQPPSAATSMNIVSPKTRYSLAEKVVIRAVADSQGTPIRGFDVAIEFDPEFLSLTNKKSPTLPAFTYYGSNSGKLLKVSAVQKPESEDPQIFKDTALFEFEFTPKKVGKTAFKIVFIPNATNESNLINYESQEILTSATGTEIEITN